MSRWMLCCGLLALAVSQTGCSQRLYDSFGRMGCQGCGHRYLGAYVEDPPRPEPCDECGNWVGHCGSQKCGGCSTRDRGTMWSFINGRLRGDEACCDCCTEGCDDSCTSCHAEIECGCGEAGCGEAECGCGVAHAGTYVERPAVATRSPRRIVQSVSRPTVVSAAAPATGRCNCGR